MRIILIISLALMLPNDLFGQLLFRNTSTEDVYLAIKYVENGTWKTQGWFKIGPLQTEQLIGKITNRYYYYYAYYYTNSKKTAWSGSDSWSWVHETNAFNTIDGQVYSSSKGYKKIGLKKLDVNNSQKFTLTLDFRSKFLKRMEEYFLKPKLDPLEGLYSISDDITIESTDFFGGKSVKREARDHWAKVAILKDTISLSRSYLELAIEANGFEEGDVRAEFLQTKQSPTIFMTEQRTKEGDPTKSVVLEFKHNEGIIEGEFEYISSGKKYQVKRSYLKYWVCKINCVSNNC